MSNKYITIATQDDSMTWRFRVIEGGYQEQFMKAGTLDRTVTGKLDIKAGSVLEVRSYVIRVRHTELDGSLYGTRANLIALFALNNPTDPDTPDLLKLTDHYGTETDVYLRNEMMGQPLSVIIDGTGAWHLFQLEVVVNP
jgi:hypothetical protein